MGNCCRRVSSSAVWDGDDWGSVEPSEKRHQQTLEKQKLLGGGGGGKKGSFGASSDAFMCNNNDCSGSKREVKIKITKRELEELMARADVRDLSLEQVLARLVINSSSTSGSDMEQYRSRSWKPALQSIPEVD